MDKGKGYKIVMVAMSEQEYNIWRYDQITRKVRKEIQSGATGASNDTITFNVMGVGQDDGT